MARKIVWTDFLKEESIFRHWYVLENNNFKNAIKAAQKDGKMNYAHMHNALYSGLYYPKKPFIYTNKTTVLIKEDKNLKKSATIANFMDRHEILKNIHAMSDSAKAIRVNKKFGYNAKMFADEFYLIGKQEELLSKKAKIKTIGLYNSLPNEKESTPNKPNRYRLARRLVSEGLENIFVPTFKTQTNAQKEEKFNKALKKYLAAKQKFEYTALKINSSAASKTKMFHQHLDEGLYRTILPHYGLDFNAIANNKNENVSKLITRKELLLHTKKLELGTKVLAKVKSEPLLHIYDTLRNSGLKIRQQYIRKERTYPECQTGFLNSFCEMISHKIDVKEILKRQEFASPALKVADNMIETIIKLKNQYELSTDPQEKKEVEEQIEKLRKSVEDSNQFNI